MTRFVLLSALMALIAPLAPLYAFPNHDGSASAPPLEGLHGTNTWGHPDEFYEQAGTKAYAAHKYQHALIQFKQASRYADKLSQLNVGLMYLNGDGVGKNPVTAYAWLSLAAERDYPAFVATRNNVGRQLTASQLDQARGVLADLLKEYGDAVAKPRMARELGAAIRLVGLARPPIGAYTYVGGAADRAPFCDPSGGRGDCGFYASWRWSPQQYFATRDAQWDASSVGKVTVLPLQKVDKPSSTDQSNH